MEILIKESFGLVDPILNKITGGDLFKQLTIQLTEFERSLNFSQQLDFALVHKNAKNPVGLKPKTKYEVDTLTRYLCDSIPPNWPTPLKSKLQSLLNSNRLNFKLSTIYCSKSGPNLPWKVSAFLIVMFLFLIIYNKIK